MWPWEHVAVGYLIYSVTVRWITGDPPGRADTYAVVFASLLPDLIDKPLSWTLGIFPSGYSIGHSVFVVAVLISLIIPVTEEVGRLRVGVAFSMGLVLHLVGDIFYPALFGEGIAPTVVLWPLVTQPAYAVEYGLIERGLLYLGRHIHMLSASSVKWLVAAEAAFLGAVVILWLVDGHPGFPRVPLT